VGCIGRRSPGRSGGRGAPELGARPLENRLTGTGVRAPGTADPIQTPGCTGRLKAASCGVRTPGCRVSLFSSGAPASSGSAASAATSGEARPMHPTRSSPTALRPLGVGPARLWRLRSTASGKSSGWPSRRRATPLRAARCEGGPEMKGYVRHHGYRSRTSHSPSRGASRSRKA